MTITSYFKLRKNFISDLLMDNKQQPNWIWSVCKPEKFYPALISNETGLSGLEKWASLFEQILTMLASSELCKLIGFYWRSKI